VASPEADGTKSAYAEAPRVLRLARPASAGLLLLLVIVGIGATSPASSGRGPLYQDSVAIAVALEFLLAALQVALVVMARRTAAASHPAGALRLMLRRVIAVVMVLIVVIAVANIVAHKRGDLLQRLLTGGHKSLPHRPVTVRHGSHAAAADHASYFVYGIVGLIVLAALITCVVLVARARTRQRRPGGYADEATDDEGPGLRQAIESGRLALRTMDDARAAIIACYVAMETSLATAGAARAAAETPDELLTRAATAGLVRGPAAATLTILFYEARFSTKPLAPAAKHAAQQAIDAISTELASRADPLRPGEPTVGAAQ
jgi:hypothetical protein